MNDTKLLLEEQTSRNTLLEKKQRKFDAEIGLLQEDKKQELVAREKLQREVDTLKAQKYGLEQQIQVSTIVKIYISHKADCKSDTSNSPYFLGAKISTIETKSHGYKMKSY